MFINEVESITRLSKKSIRYYEEVGLIKPNRDQNNDYRIYNNKDILILKRIKFLRDLGVPINELQKLNNNETSLDIIIKDRIKKIEIEENKYLTIKNMCNSIIDENLLYENLDIDKYFECMNKLNKEGFTMKENKDNKRKEIITSIISSLVFILLDLILLFAIILDKEVPILISIMFVIIFGLPVIGIIINLILRIKEINGGEIYEASKY